MARLLSIVPLLLLLGPSLAEETVTISSDIPRNGHDCISDCLYSTFLTDMGAIMGCDLPYENACYCATATASASVADSWMSRCASSQCGRGDVTRDLTSMQSIYGSYCMAAGFTQPGATEWYNPAEVTEEPTSASSASDEDSATQDAAPSKTANSGLSETTTEWSVVTQTTEGGSGATKSQVIVQATTTLWVNSDGSPASLDIDDSDDNSSVKIGVGIAIPVAAILATAFGWWFWRRRRRSVPGTQPSEETGVSTNPSAPAVAAVPVTRKPVGTSTVSPVSPVSKTNELHSDSLKGEVDGQEVKPLPVVTPSPPVQVPGQHEVTGDTVLRPEMDGRSERVEVSGEGRPPELSGQSQSPPPVYTTQAEHPAQRWELPDNSR